jgi:hypothetical protein
VIAYCLESDLRLEVSSIEGDLSRSGASGEFGTKSGACDGSEGIVSGKGECEGMASIGRCGRCIDDLDC